MHYDKTYLVLTHTQTHNGFNVCLYNKVTLSLRAYLNYWLLKLEIANGRIKEKR